MEAMTQSSEPNHGRSFPRQGSAIPQPSEALQLVIEESWSIEQTPESKRTVEVLSRISRKPSFRPGTTGKQIRAWRLEHADNLAKATTNPAERGLIEDYRGSIMAATDEALLAEVEILAP